jgi:hypothetical protein
MSAPGQRTTGFPHVGKMTIKKSPQKDGGGGLSHVKKGYRFSRPQPGRH